MRRRLFPTAAATLALSLGAANADPATQDGAKAMAAAYAAWFSPAALEKGILAVAAEGDDYVVTWDLAKALAAADAPAGVTVAPFVYRVTPTLEGGWFAHTASLPGLSFSSAGKEESGAIAFDGFRFDGLFDPDAADFFRSKLTLGAVKMDIRTKSGAQMQRVVLTQDGLAGDLRVRPGEDEGGVDLRLSQSVASSGERTSAVDSEQHETGASETRQGAATGQSVVTGWRAAAFGDLWRFLVAHAQSGPPSGEDLKPKLAALLPLWKEISGEVEVGDVAVTFPGGSLSLKSAGEDVKMSGLLPQSSATLALAVKDLTVELDAAPDWVKTLWPLTLALQLEGGIEGLDRAAEIALDDPELFKSGDLGADAKAAIVQTLASGHPHLALSETRLASPLIDATFAGEAHFGESGPEASGKITADDLDKLLAAIARIAESEPDARQFLFLATFVRGLAKSEDGRLVWNLEYVAPNAVKVNGQLFPPK